MNESLKKYLIRIAVSLIILTALIVPGGFPVDA